MTLAEPGEAVGVIAAQSMGSLTAFRAAFKSNGKKELKEIGHLKDLGYIINIHTYIYIYITYIFIFLYTHVYSKYSNLGGGLAYTASSLIGKVGWGALEFPKDS